MTLLEKLHVDSDRLHLTKDYIYSRYVYRDTHVYSDETTTSSSGGGSEEGPVKVVPYEREYTFRTERKTPRLGLMMVGWGGNNGSTLTAALLAHRHGLEWRTRRGIQQPNYYGSLVMSSTIRLGYSPLSGESMYWPMHTLLPFVSPESIVVGGWDISSSSLALAMERACVLEPDLVCQLNEEMSNMVPLPAVYSPDFIAANQSSRADNLLLAGTGLKEKLNALRKHIRDFKKENNLDTVIVVWTANTERYADVLTGVNDTASALLSTIDQEGENDGRIAPSTLYGVAAILEGCAFINGSPQNTFVPGLVDLALLHSVPIAGDDFKSGQTKLKSVLVDFLIGAGIKPIAITSYNHLGNNDGYNLSAPLQFRSKEISKSNVVDDAIKSNHLLYPMSSKGPDHVVVIKYVPAVGDSKRALDEYESEIFMGGRSTISIHNTCEDSLLAAPLILDLVLLAEFLSRVSVSEERHAVSNEQQQFDTLCFQPLDPVLSHLSYLLKAPLVPSGTPVINALFKQRASLENFFRALLSLSPNSDMALEQKLIKRK